MPVQIADASGWRIKSKALRVVLAQAATEALDEAGDDLFKRVVRNVSGPHYPIGTRGPGTGKMPVPRVTKALAAAQKRKKLSPSLRAIYTDLKMAPHAKHVHWGTKKMRKRWYMKDVRIDREYPTLGRMAYLIWKKVREVGRK